MSSLLADPAPAPGMVEPPRPTESAPGLPGRAEVVARLVAVLAAEGVEWAWQGPDGAVARWVDSDGPADLDVWWRPGPTGHGTGPTGTDPVDRLVARLCRELPATPVADSRDPARLQHTSLVVETRTGLAVLDLTHGDLRVGPVLLVPAHAVEADSTIHRLVGAAAAADLLVRPLLRGRVPAEDRLAQARSAWQGADSERRAQALRTWRGALGSGLAREIGGVLDGASTTPALPRRAVRAKARASLSPRTLPSTWRARRAVLPARGAAGPLELRTRGVVVAFVGTDGSGKSTVSADLGRRLEAHGLPTASAYFGMARGNLPGVALARRLLGLSGTPAPTPAANGAGPARETSPRPDAHAPGSGDSPAGPAPLDHAPLRRAAAWFYAGEYLWRYATRVAPARRRRAVVLVDRYVYDLRESPWPGSRASAWAERLIPAPDLLVLPDAPDDLIHARKPERHPDEQARIQQRYRDLLAEGRGRVGNHVVDTSGQTPDAVAGLALAVISAAHMTPREAGSAGRAGR